MIDFHVSRMRLKFGYPCTIELQNTVSLYQHIPVKTQTSLCDK